jgi:hypothetical protein
MLRLSLLVLLGLMTSCDFFVSKEKKTQQLIHQKLNEINWNEIDSYPLFEVCDELVSKTIQRECFERELLKHCAESLNEFEYTFDATIDPTIQVDFLVDKDGRISVLNIDKDAAIDDQMPEFDGIIRQSLKNLPPLAPALKRAMPVKAKFRMPIVLQYNNQ